MSNSNQTFRGKLSPELSGDPYYIDYAGVTTSGSTTTIATIVVASGFQLYLLQANCTCKMPITYQIKIDGVMVASGRTMSANPNADFYFSPYRLVDEGEELKIEFSADGGKPNSDVEFYLQARQITL